MGRSVRRQFKNIARVARAHGKYGEVVAAPLRGLPPLLQEGMRVCLTPPALGRERWSVVESVSPLKGDEDLVKLSCAQDMTEAEALVGCLVLADAADLELDELDLRDDELVGREVVDAASGSVGLIAEVVHGPAQDIWMVRGAYGEVMVPAVGAVVKRLPQEGPIEVDLPCGLLDL